MIKTLFHLTMLCLVPLGMIAQGEVIDRMVAVVENHIITLSDIRAERTIREVLGEEAPKDDRELLDELIDQHLIHTQLESYPQADPTEAELDEELRRVQDRKGLPVEIVREAIRDHLRVQRFFMERFGRFINPTDAEVRNYYEQVFLPAAQARNLSDIPQLSEIAPDIRKNVIQEQLASEVKKWLEQTRRTVKMEIFK